MNYKLWRKVLAPLIQFLWPVEVLNKYKFTEEKGVYICNHYSVMDGNHFATQLFEKKLNIVVKDEALSSKIGRKFLLGLGGIPIQRGEADMRAIKKCMTVLRNNESLVIFPEGTRNKSGSKEMLAFKEGPVMFALKTKSPVIPMMYYRPIRLFRKTYLIIGDKVDLSQYYDMPAAEARGAATDFVRAKMEELRYEIDSIVEDKNKLKINKKNNRMRIKEKNKANRQAKRISKKSPKDAIDVKVES